MKYVCLALALFTAVGLLTDCYSHSKIATMKQPPSANEIYQDPLAQPAEVSVTGEYMQAFLVAYEAFQKDVDIPREKKRIENYSIEFRQNSMSYTIFFFAKRGEAERLSPGGESSLGKDVSFRIRKKDFQVIDRLFYR